MTELHGIELLDENTFGSAIASGTVLVDFFATWCGPCRQQLTILAELLASGRWPKAIAIGKVDIDRSEKLAEHFRIETVPTLIIFKDGKAIKSFIGVQTPERLLEAVSKP